MGLTSAQRHNRMMLRIWMNKTGYDKRLLVETAHVQAIKDDIGYDLVKRYAYMEGTEKATA